MSEAEAAKELLPGILEQEENLRFPSFTSDTAFTIGNAIRQTFLKDATAGKKWAGRGIVISISTFTGHQMFCCAVGNESTTTPGNWRWIEGKKNVVRMHNHSSFYVGRNIISTGRKREDVLPFPEFAAHGGAFPIWIKNAPVAPLGTIIVSGLKEDEDHQIICDVLTELIPNL